MEQDNAVLHEVDHTNRRRFMIGMYVPLVALMVEGVRAAILVLSVGTKPPVFGRIPAEPIPVDVARLAVLPIGLVGGVAFIVLALYTVIVGNVVRVTEDAGTVYAHYNGTSRRVVAITKQSIDRVGARDESFSTEGGKAKRLAVAAGLTKEMRPLEARLKAEPSG